MTDAATSGSALCGPAKKGNSMSDYYAILGLGREASEAEIKKGYRKMAVKWCGRKDPG